MSSVIDREPAVFGVAGQGAPWGHLVLDLDNPNAIGSEDHEIFLATLAEVEQGSGLDIRSRVHDAHDRGIMDELADTRVAQLIGLGAGVAAARILINRGVFNRRNRGHSAGAFPAAVLAGSLALVVAAEAVKRRGETMHAAAKKTPDAVVAATSGVTFEGLEDLCEEIDEFAAPINDNSPKQIIVAGTAKAISALKDKVVDLNGRLTPLPNWRAGLPHTEKVIQVQRALERFFNPNKQRGRVEFIDPITGYIRCLDGIEAKTGDDVRLDLVSAAAPVRFTQGTELLLQSGERCFIEISPGRNSRSRVLSGLMKDHDLPQGTKVEHVHDLLSLQKA